MKIEEERLSFIRGNQNKLKAHLYQKTVVDDTHETRPPKIILPATFESSPRNVISNYEDVMSICEQYGKPTYFITFTCNAAWTEITENLKVTSVFVTSM